MASVRSSDRPPTRVVIGPSPPDVRRRGVVGRCPTMAGSNIRMEDRRQELRRTEGGPDARDPTTTTARRVRPTWRPTQSARRRAGRRVVGRVRRAGPPPLPLGAAAAAARGRRRPPSLPLPAPSAGGLVSSRSSLVRRGERVERGPPVRHPPEEPRRPPDSVKRGAPTAADERRPRRRALKRARPSGRRRRRGGRPPRDGGREWFGVQEVRAGGGVCAALRGPNDRGRGHTRRPPARGAAAPSPARQATAPSLPLRLPRRPARPLALRTHPCLPPSLSHFYIIAWRHTTAARGSADMGKTSRVLDPRCAPTHPATQHATPRRRAAVASPCFSPASAANHPLARQVSRGRPGGGRSAGARARRRCADAVSCPVVSSLGVHSDAPVSPPELIPASRGTRRQHPHFGHQTLLAFARSRSGMYAWTTRRLRVAARRGMRACCCAASQRRFGGRHRRGGGTAARQTADGRRPLESGEAEALCHVARGAS